MKYIICVILLFSTFSFADNIIPHQSKEIIEVYRSENHDCVRVELKESYDYIRRDKVFLFPADYHGNSEYYDLGFYIDLDLRINDDLDANDYRILYKNSVPEPTSILILLLFGTFIFARKRKI
jgi:hypothetical protein